VVLSLLINEFYLPFENICYPSFMVSALSKSSSTVASKSCAQYYPRWMLRMLAWILSDDKFEKLAKISDSNLSKSINSCIEFQVKSLKQVHDILRSEMENSKESCSLGQLVAIDEIISFFMPEWFETDSKWEIGIGLSCNDREYYGSFVVPCERIEDIFCTLNRLAEEKIVYNLINVHVPDLTVTSSIQWIQKFKPGDRVMKVGGFSIICSKANGACGLFINNALRRFSNESLIYFCMQCEDFTLDVPHGKDSGILSPIDLRNFPFGKVEFSSYPKGTNASKIIRTPPWCQMTVYDRYCFSERRLRFVAIP